jgi:5-methylcytosine-specific restriction protein B
MGNPQTIVAPPTAVTYRAIREQAAHLFTALQPYNVRNWVDVQSFIWVCFRESKNRVGRLNSKGQIDLDVPPTEPTAETTYNISQEVALVRENTEPFIPMPENPIYSLDQCAAETGFAAADLQNWANAIERKGQAVLYGPPGTGKTFLAQKLAQHLIGGSDGFTELIQFHPAYAYEDFVQGIRPFTHNNTILYKMVPGRLLQFCEKARQRNGRCILIIDEINRANLAAVFGELMYLLEYREQDIALAGNGRFSLPANLRILGTMNTADRSIALVDHALRRRFAFIHLPPNYNLLHHYHRDTDFNPSRLINLLQQLNNQIGDPHYHIGPTFFLQPQLNLQLESIWRLEIEPYLEEYFFGQQDKAAAFRWTTIKAQLLDENTR